MIEAQIPKDIRKYESKLVGPFTLRQLICFLIGCACAFVGYKVIGPLVGQDSSITIAFFLAIPGVAFGWIKPYGMALEKFLQTALISNFIAPKHRKYKIKNGYKTASDKLTVQKKKEYKKRMKAEKKLAQSDSKYIAYK